MDCKTVDGMRFLEKRILEMRLYKEISAGYTCETNQWSGMIILLFLNSRIEFP
ncbi:MAG: hypothetical protein ACOX1K_05345 [Defluviitoga tunisiensis]